MKAVIKFFYDTENYEQLAEIELMRKAGDYKSVLWDLSQHLREQLKYNEELSDDAQKALEEVRQLLFDLINDHGISLL